MLAYWIIGTSPGTTADSTRATHVRVRAGARSAVTLAAALAMAPGCNFAVNHPAVTAGIVGTTLGFTTCNLASDNLGACLAVGGGAGAFLGLVAATALWLGGDGHSVMVEEQAQPLPDDGRPRKRRKPPAEPDEPGATAPGPGGASPPSPTSAPASPGPAPASPTPTPAGQNSTPASPSPAPANPDPTPPGPASPSSAPASPAIPSPMAAP